MAHKLSSTRRVLLAVLTLALGAGGLGSIVLADPAAASGSGGIHIATAPTITYGAMEFGNDSAGNNQTQQQYWLMPLQAGDEVSISMDNSTNTVQAIDILQPGSTDSNPNTARSFQPGAVPAYTATYTAPTTGIYPLDVRCEENYRAGPFEVVVNVHHDALLYLPSVTKVGPAGKYFKLPVAVRTASGTPVTDHSLTLRLYGRWKDLSYVPATLHLMASASPSNGIAFLVFKIPPSLKGRWLPLFVTARGPDYRPTNSAVRVVRVEP